MTRGHGKKPLGVAAQDLPDLSDPAHLRRSKRTNAGQNGYAAQLEQAAFAIETPRPATRQQVDLPVLDNEPVNFMAPTTRPASRPRKKAPSSHHSSKGSRDRVCPCFTLFIDAKLIYTLADLSNSIF
jgi:hypothetical protein